jgi:pimeloyl-ACP methyl ester carboxylesterase
VIERFAGIEDAAALVESRILGFCALVTDLHLRTRATVTKAMILDVLTELGVGRTDVLGFSLGGLVAVEFARRHPGRLRRLVLAAVHSRPDGYHDEIRSPDTRPGVGLLHETDVVVPILANFLAE